MAQVRDFVQCLETLDEDCVHEKIIIRIKFKLSAMLAFVKASWSSFKLILVYTRFEWFPESVLSERKTLDKGYIVFCSKTKIWSICWLLIRCPTCTWKSGLNCLNMGPWGVVFDTWFIKMYTVQRVVQRSSPYCRCLLKYLVFWCVTVFGLTGTVSQSNFSQRFFKGAVGAIVIISVIVNLQKQMLDITSIWKIKGLKHNSTSHCYTGLWPWP